MGLPRLQVEMTDTIVYSSAETYLFVVPNLLQPIINGGIQRYVSRQQIIVMNGSLSHDPDFPSADDLRYVSTLKIERIKCDQRRKKVHSYLPPLNVFGGIWRSFGGAA